MANPFTSIACTIRHDNARMITWTMLPGANYPEDFILQVENSRTGGEWHVLSTGLQGTCVYIDSRRRNYNTHMNECYRLRMIVPSTGEEHVSDIVDAGNHKAYPYSAEAENVVKQAETQIEESGCHGQLLKRKIWGVHCPLCVDFEGQQTVNEHCPRCLGTGIDGGYFPGIGLWVIKDQITTSESPSQIGFIQGETVQARCIAYPWICYDDVWCEDNTNKRYMIKQITPAASYKTTALVYSLKMMQVEYNDVIHSVPADVLVAEQGSWENKKASTMPSRSGWDEVLEKPW